MKSAIKNFFSNHLPEALIGVLIISSFMITFGMVSSIKSNIDSFGLITSPVAATEDEAIAVAIGEQYIVKEFDGRIGVFVPGDTQPIRVIQVYVMYLPESDRTDLRNGITVNSKTALERLLDDFRS